MFGFRASPPAHFNRIIFYPYYYLIVTKSESIREMITLDMFLVKGLFASGWDVSSYIRGIYNTLIAEEFQYSIQILSN